MRKFLPLFVFALVSGSMLLPPATKPAEAQSNCPPLKQLGSINLQKAGNRWLVPVGINSIPRTMFLNTGQGVTTFTPESVAELKLPTRNTRNAVYISSDGQRSYSYTHVNALALGLAGQFSNSDYIMLPPLPNNQKRPANSPVGFLGLELLSHFDFDLDLKSGVMNLFSFDHCDGQVVYWKTDAAVIVPFEWDAQGRIRFKVALDGTDLYAVLDTMDTDDTLNLQYYQSQAKFDVTAPGVQQVGTAGDGGKIFRATFKTLDLHGITIQNPNLLVQEDKLKQQVRATSDIGSNIRDSDMTRLPDITLGVSTLAKFHVYVAARERKMYISVAP